jgi:hypothetical protein
MTPRNKKAGGCHPPATPTTAVPYRPFQPYVKRNLPGRRDRRPPQMPDRRPSVRPTPAPSPRPGAATDGAALSLLACLLALQAGTLAPRQQAKAWGYVDGWSREIVGARHTSEAA